MMSIAIEFNGWFKKMEKHAIDVYRRAQAPLIFFVEHHAEIL
jgi:hypothetical protein